MFQGMVGFACCGRDSCGNGVKSSGTTVVKRKPTKAPDVESDLKMLESELSEISELPLPLPKWGSFSDVGADSDIEIANITADYKPLLDRCALSLKASVAKARHLQEREANRGADSCLLPSLCAAERSCALFADKDNVPALASITRTKTMIKDASSLEHGVSHLARGQTAIDVDQCFSEPAGVHLHATQQDDSGADVPSEGEESNDGGVDARYRHLNVPTVIQGLRERMAAHGIHPPEALMSSHRGAVSPGRRQRQNHGVQVQSRAEVQKYQAVMRSKFEAIGVPDAQGDVFVDTAYPSLAVRDAVSKYHTHCRDMNKYYAMPGEKEDDDACLSWEQHTKLDHYVRDLQSDGHVHAPQR